LINLFKDEQEKNQFIQEGLTAVAIIVIGVAAELLM
jgi:hypothetical protein